MEPENSSAFININETLNDDCLISIFECLSFNDRFMIELVCKRWNTLGKLSWSKVESLQINKRFKDSNFIINLIRKRGPYITDLLVDGAEDRGQNMNLSNHIVFKETSEICKNITNLKIVRYNSSDSDFERYLELIFKNNKKISSISIIGSSFKSEFLLYLCANSITKFHINSCSFTLLNFYTFLSKLINLKVCKIINSVKFRYFSIRFLFDSEDMIAALNKSNCEKIHEFSLENGYAKVSELKNLLCKQLNLCKLNLKDTNVNRDLLESLKDCPLQELELKELDEDMSCTLKYFENLTVLKCKIPKLTDKFVKNLRKSRNLKIINFDVTNVSLTKDCESDFSDFSKLESLTLKCSSCYIYKILNIMVRKKDNLKELGMFCVISQLEQISLYRNLTVLKLYELDIFSYKFINLINELKSLREIYVYSSYVEFDNEFFEKINVLKINRGDKHILKIYLYGSSEYECSLVHKKSFTVEK